MDLFSYFRDKFPAGQFEELYWPIDRHHNAAGYRAFAQAVAEAINDAQLIR